MTDLVPKEQKPQRLIWLAGGLAVAIVALLACLACMFFFVLPGLFSGGVGIGSTAPQPTPTIGKLASPVIDFPVEGKVGEPVTFDGSQSRPGSSPIVSYAWDFGDGSTGSGSVVTHIYKGPGTYQVTMTVTDQDGFGNTAGPVQITIRGDGGSGSTAPESTPTIGELASPVIDYPTEGKVGEPVTFDGSKSRPGSSPIASYAWDFGDGSTGSGSVVTHVYRGPGTYQVTMTVTDQNGFGNTAGPVQITIRAGVGSSPTAPQPTSTTAPQPTSTTAPQPTPTIGELASPVIDFPVEGKVGEPVTFDGSQSRPGSSPIASYAWDFGDGSTGSGSVVTHVYNDPGTYQVTMTITDQDGFGNTAGPVEIQVTK